MGWVKQQTGIDIANPIGSASDLATNTFNTAVNTVQAILKNPLPVVAQVVGASFGVPPYVTAAVITGVQGGNIGDIAKSAALSYASSELMSGTQFGADIKNYAVNMPSGDITDWAMENFNLSPDQAVMVAKASSAALNSSVIGGINAALTGRSVAQGVSSGFTSGLIYSSTDSYFNSVNKDPNWGFSPTALNVMKGATSTALNTLVSGKGDPAQAVGNYIAYAGLNMAGSEVSRMAKDAYVNLTTDTEAAQKAQDKFTTYKAELDSKAVEAENLRQSIIQNNAELKSLSDVAEYQSYKNKYIDTSTNMQLQKNIYQTLLNDYYAKLDKYNKAAANNDTQAMSILASDVKNVAIGVEAWGNALTVQNNRLQSYYNDAKPFVDAVKNKEAEIEKKVADFNAIRSDIEAPNADGTNLAAKAMAASKEYETKYLAWSKTKAAADAANENYTKTLAEVATRNATIDALNSGAIKATGKDEAGNWLLNNGMTLTKDGRFMQDGQQAFTNAAGVDQNKIDFKDAGGKQVSFDINSIFNTAYANSQDARSSLMTELNQSNLTSEERTALNAAMQDVFAQSSTAQALPATTTDISTGTSRLGSAFASNDPVFKTALAKNPTLTKAFNEYTNTYGFAGGYDYGQLLNESLAQNPNDPNLQAEYKKVTGKDYQAPVSGAERIRQENAAKGLTPLTPTELPARDAVVNVEAGMSTPTLEQDAALLDNAVIGGPATTTVPIESVKLDLPQQNTTTVLPIDQANAGFNVGTSQVAGSTNAPTNTAGTSQATTTQPTGAANTSAATTAGVTSNEVTQAINQAIAGIQFPAGITPQDVAAQIRTVMAENPGLTASDVATQIANYMKANPPITSADVTNAISASSAAMKTNLADTEKSILAEVAKNQAAGMTRDAALQKAIDTVAAAQKTDTATLTQNISGLKTSLGQEINAVQTDLDQTEKTILAEVAKNEAAGMTRDAALQKAIDTVAATQKTDTASLLSKLGTTESALKTQISTQVSGLDAKLTAAIADAKSAGLSGDAALRSAIDKVAADQKTSSAELLSQLGTTEAALKTQFTAQVEGLDQKLSNAIADAKASGLQGDAALQAAINKVAADQKTTSADLLSQMNRSSADLKTQFAADLAGVSSQSQAQYNSLTAAQKAEVDARIRQGEDLQTAIANSQAATQQQITGLSQTQAQQYAQLSQGQQSLYNQLVAQGASQTDALNAAVSGLQTTQAQQYGQLSQGQKDLFNQMVAQGASQTEALNTAISGVQGQITAGQQQTAATISQLDANTQAKFAALTQEQQNQALALANSTKDLQGSINSVSQQVASGQQQTQQQITGLETSTQAKFDALTAAQKELVLSQAKQGVDLAAAINDVSKTTTQQITDVKTNIIDTQKQFNDRVDQLMKQGKDYQTATNTAIKEIGTGVAGLQTNLTELQAQQAAEKAKAEAAAKAARAAKAQQGISQNLANAAAMATPTLAAGIMDETIPGYKDIGLKTSGEAKFEGPLDQYLKMVKENAYVPKPQQPQQQNQQGSPMQDALTPSQQGSDYFAYGQQPEMNDLLGGFSGGDLLYSKEGGLALPMMGGNTRYGKYAGGGLNVINHSGKARLDFRKGDAVTGAGDGQSDDIPAMLADGEFVFPADVVAALGNGSTKAGSDKLYDMMHSIRAYHRSAKPEDLPPPAKTSPLDYLKKSNARR